MDYLPPGFRFYPTEEELVSFYLHNKLEGRRHEALEQVIPVLSIYDFNPWDLPQFAGERCRGDPEQCFFFIPRQERETRGGRPNRLTPSGYWKATGSPGCVCSSRNHIIGMRRTMVFYNGRAPNGRKTEWKMNEYMAAIHEGEASSSSSTSAIPKWRKEFSLCRIYKKSNCLRAFDRRPSAESSLVQQDHHGDDDRTTTSHHNHPAVERTSSPDSSSSGDYNNPPQIIGSSDMDVDSEPMWDWEQLNWF